MQNRRLYIWWTKRNIITVKAIAEMRDSKNFCSTVYKKCAILNLGDAL